jgi:hypothetical protein
MHKEDVRVGRTFDEEIHAHDMGRVSVPIKNFNNQHIIILLHT